MKRIYFLLTLLAATAATRASIVNVGGSGDLLTAGPGVGYTADFFGDISLVIHGWDEIQNYTLTSNLAVDITTGGIYNSPGALTPGFIPAGTVVNSHAFFFDPAAGGSTVAAFQFDGPVIGVIVNDTVFPDPFLASDFLIPTSVPSSNIPPGHFAARGLEIGINTDHLNASGNSVTLFLSAGSPGDQLRVLTAVPEPGLTGLLVIAGGALLARRRFSR